MTGSATAQGTSPQEPMLLDQAAKPGRVSADSFRKLTSLLKKPDTAAPSSIVIPDFVAPKPAAPQTSAPQVAAVAPAVIAAPPKSALVPVAPPPRAFEIPARATPVLPPAPAYQPPSRVVEPVVAAQPAIEPEPVIIAPAPPDEILAEPELVMPPAFMLDPSLLPREAVFEPKPLPPAPVLEPEPKAAVPVAIEAAAPQADFASIAPQPFEREFISLRKAPEAQAATPVPAPVAEAAAEPVVLSPVVAPPPKPRVEVPEVFHTPEQEAEAAELARSLLDMMAQGSAAGQPQERALAADTLLRMLPRLPLKSRVMLASRLCLMEQPHHLLVAKLITDPDIAVAGPLLEECAHLTDEDLLRVLAENDPAKRRMMARRRKISRTVTTALIETNDGSVLLTIARNAGAEITTEGFAMMERAASRRGELLAPMCIRADLPVHFAFSLFWFAPPELRRYLLTRFLTDSETLTKILKIARGTHGADMGEKMSNDPQLVKLALAKAAGGDFGQAAQPLSEMSSLAPETITRILQDKQGEPLMALLKTLSFPRSQVQDQVEALQGSLIDPSRNAEDLQSLFDSLSFNKARILLTYWDWSSLGTGPYALLQ